MNKQNLSRRGVIGASVAAATVLGTGALTTAQAAEPSPAGPAGSRGSTGSTGSTGSNNDGIPTSVDAATDLASKGADGGSDSIYFTSRVKSRGHSFGILVQTVNSVAGDARIMTVAVTDETTGWHKYHQVNVAKDDYTWSTEGLTIKMPGLTWTGDSKKMSVEASTPWGSLDLVLVAEGPVLNYAGTGLFDMLGEPQHEFALPAMRTTGTLTVDDRTFRVSGESWLDRQWGNLPLGASNKWTWLNFSLSNGDKVALWDIVGADKENCWATVLHPDGSYELVAVKPLADSEGDYWTSPDSGRSYPTSWRVEIPSLQADLAVRITGTKAQELIIGRLIRYEATATATGTYKGRRVTGHNFVEIVS